MNLERGRAAAKYERQKQDTIMWLPVAAGGEKEITSAPPRTGDSKGGGKKGITSVKILQGALDREDTQGPGACSLTQEETGQNQQNPTIAMVI